MRKIFSFILAAIIAVSISACSSNPASGTPTSSANSESASKTEEVKPKVLSAEDVAKKLKESGLPIDNIIVYTEDTDTNKLLGRPNQYISKVNFADTTVEQGDDKEEPVGGSVETFNNSDDLKARKEYCETIAKKASIFAQYIYVNGNYLLRIDNDVSPTNAKKYEEAFAKIK